MALSNGLVIATAVMLVVPETAAGHGQVGSAATHSCPGDSSGAVAVATELLPDGTPSSSGSLLSELMSNLIGSVERAVMTSPLVSVGTSQCGLPLAVIGSGTVSCVSVKVVPPTTLVPRIDRCVRPFRRGSAK